MAIYDTFAIAFLISTIFMVGAVLFMGFQNWRDERRLPDPVRRDPNERAEVPLPPIPANDDDTKVNIAG